MTIQNEIALWKQLYREGRVSWPELPSSFAELIQAVENPDCRAGVDLLMKCLVATHLPQAYTAIERWADSSDRELADSAFRRLGGVPIPHWADLILKRMAETAGHPRRYEAMLLLNSLSLHRPLFESALHDSDATIRLAGYSSFAIHGRLEQLVVMLKGLDDASVKVREHVSGLLLGALEGSDIDERKPLLKRRWKKTEAREVRKLILEMRSRFRRLAGSDPDERVRLNAAIALLTLSPKEAPQLLFALRASPLSQVREIVASHLPLFRGKIYEQASAALLKDPAAQVRRYAIQALSQSKNRRFACSLFTELQKTEQDPVVREDLLDALDKCKKSKRRRTDS